MARKLESVAKSIGAVLGERKKLDRVEKKLVGTLNRALSKIGYRVVPSKGVAPAKRRRRRARRTKPAARPRRRTAARRRRARARRK